MPRPLTVMHVLNGASGGAAMSTIALIEKLKPQGILACAVCDDRGTPEERERLSAAVNGNVLFTPLYWWNRKIRSSLWKRPLLEAQQIIRTGWTVRSTRRIVQAAQHWRPDLIHTNTLLTPEGGKAAKKLQIPHVWHVRELIGPTFPFRLNRTGQALGKYLVHFCDRVIANSEVTGAQISPWLPNGYVTVIPNGIDCESFKPRQRSESKARTVIAMVANLGSRVKKHHLFIEAAARIDSRLPIDWRIYGYDPSEAGRIHSDAYVNSLHSLARDLKIDAKLRYPGHCPPTQIMNEIDILIHPTDVESFGRVVVEAMAAGIPVIGARGGGVAEIVRHGETGLLFRPDDSNDLARCIERLIRDGEFSRRCATAGRSRAIQEYGIENTASKIARVYDEVLQNYDQRSRVLEKNPESASIR